MTSLERQRLRRSLAGQGVVYAVALIAVLLIVGLMELGPPRAAPPPTEVAAGQPPLFPQSP